MLCRWARKALQVLLGLILNGGAGGLGRSTNQDTYDKLEPPFLEEMMRDGLPEDQELLPGMFLDAVA